MVLPDGIESDDSEKDRYQPEDADLMQEVESEDEDETEDEDEKEVEIENEDEDEVEKKVVVSKKGKKSEKAKLGCSHIAAIRTTVPTTGTKSAVEHSKPRERSSRSVQLNLCI